MRIVFMGTPEFALPALAALREAYDVVAVFTQPDREAGRGRRPQPPPVKRYAEAHGLPVYQPERLRRPEALAVLKELKPDLIVVAAYGQILPPAVLELPPHGCLNLHPSLLPRYRGASPVAAAILNGDTETGVTVMLIDAGLDTGPIVAQRAVPIEPTDTTGSLTARLAEVGAQLLLEVLPDWTAGRIAPQPQDESRATMTYPLSAADRELDWTRPAVELERRVRALQPWPEAATRWQGKLLKVLAATVLPGREDSVPGRVVALAPPSPTPVGVETGQGVLGLLQVQLQGGRAMSAREFLNGHRAFLGSQLPS